MFVDQAAWDPVTSFDEGRSRVGWRSFSVMTGSVDWASCWFIIWLMSVRGLELFVLVS